MADMQAGNAYETTRIPIERMGYALDTILKLQKHLKEKMCRQKE